jgi:dTDP-4-dehydrorhamnose 3,5-epimerase
MGSIINNEIITTPLKQVNVEGGNVLHALKNTDNGYHGFGEAYFSWIEHGSIKAWKRHLRMTMNLIVPVGNVQFVFITDEGNLLVREIIGENNYVRITVPPGIWFGFKGEFASKSLVLNLASITHDPDEVERLPKEVFNDKFL